MGEKDRYFDVIYFRDEYGEDKYPQKLCDHIIEKYFSPNSDVAGKKVLDIGSGKGNHLVGFSRRGLKAFGVDKRVEEYELLKDFTIKSCDIEKEPLPYKDEKFDFLFSKSVLEHVVNTDNFLSEAYRVLKPGGRVVFMTPDWRSQCLCFWDDYTHVKAFTRKSLQNALLLNNYKNVDCEYFLQFPVLWKYPCIKVFCAMVSILPDSCKWKDKEESQFRSFIRFSKEKMLLVTAEK